jgi:AraC-like DNA-binding protein
MLGQPLYNRLFSKPRMLRVRDDNRLLDFFARLDTYHRIYSPEDFARCAACIIQELATWCSYRRDDLNRSRSGSPAHIDEIIRYISDNLTQPLDAARIADHFLLSKSYVQNLFSQTMHIGLKKYIQQKKIYAARAELQQGITPGEAAAKYGFADYSGFYRLYKATFGTAPAKRSPTENTTPR